MYEDIIVKKPKYFKVTWDKSVREDLDRQIEDVVIKEETPERPEFCDCDPHKTGCHQVSCETGILISEIDKLARYLMENDLIITLGSAVDNAIALLKMFQLRGIKEEYGDLLGLSELGNH